MAKHVHVHIHRAAKVAGVVTQVLTRDNWEEGKHPRADNGQFGHGKGTSAGVAAVKKSGTAAEAYKARQSSITSLLDSMAGVVENEGEHAALHEAAEFLGANTKGESVSETVHTIKEALSNHAKKQDKDAANWGHAGDLGNVEKKLADAVKEFNPNKTGSRQATLRESGSPRYAGRTDPTGGEKKMSKADSLKAAKAEYAKANAGTGNFAKAAELFDAAGHEDKAAGARALAKRYGHDAEGQQKKAAADNQQADGLLHEAKLATGAQKAYFKELGDLYRARAKDPESNELTKKIRALTDAGPGSDEK